MLNDAIRKLKKIKRYSPFFLGKTIDDIIHDIEESVPVTCGHCKYMTMEYDGVNWCRMYKCAKPWDGYCEKGEER